MSPDGGSESDGVESTDQSSFARAAESVLPYVDEKFEEWYNRIKEMAKQENQ